MCWWCRRAGPELSSQPRRHSRHDRGTGEWGTVCGALCHPDRYDAAEGLYDTLYSKADQETEAASMSAMVVFPLYYLALVLTMTAATILTVQQLSETDRYRGQFALLRKLGMDRREMRRRWVPVCTYYAMPALPPALIAVPFLLNLGGAVEPGTMTGI